MHSYSVANITVRYSRNINAWKVNMQEYGRIRSNSSTIYSINICKIRD